MSRIQTRLPSIPVRTPKTRFQAKDDEPNKTGQRVTIPSLNKTGTLRFVGQVDGKTGIFAGVELDEKGQGKNDGSVQGKKYFTCPAKSGIFIAVDKVIIHSPPLPTTKPPASMTPPTARRSNLPLTRSGSTNSAVRLSASTSTSRKSHTLRSSTIPKTKPSSSPAPPKKNNSTGAISASPAASASVVTSAATSSTSSTSSSPAINKKPTPTPPPNIAAAISPKKQSRTPPIPTPPSTVVSPVLSQQQLEQQDTINRLHDMLEETQRERDQLLVQMKSKETAWERLVSSKESLSVQVKEGESQCQRLARDLEQAQSKAEQLQNDLAEREAALAKNQRDEEKQSQDQRRIERLENLVRELQNQLQTTKEEQMQLNREHAGTMEQVRKEVSASEAMTASLEKECEELRRAGLEAIHAYEGSVIELKQKHEADLRQKDQQIRQLEYTIADLRYKQSTLFDDDERDIETRLNEMNRSYISGMANSTPDEVDQRHRLEEQLELAMTELDSERLTIRNMGHDMEQLKLELSQARKQTLIVERKFESLQIDFEKELTDKKRLIEEADNAFEAQAKAEDEHYQLKLSKMALEKENNELIEANKQLEHDFNNLMDEMLVLEKKDLKTPSDSNNEESRMAIVQSSPNDRELQLKIQQLEKENEKHRNSLSAEKSQVNQLSKDLAEMESLVESRVFSEADLESKLEAERKKVASLQKELQDLKNQGNGNSNYIISPTPPPQAATAATAKSNEDYCELCDSYGHDVLQCKAELALGKVGIMSKVLIELVANKFLY
ncbi:hypothetical protein [Parasitella parasitica]|uniref:CAP-Gly domain-containing protein n=1 Tax=Parasitella parasitica TaxID=35722 RepID=A0A0B7MYN6_9FUNG|nr:hypothetical protein [Parasitella parasitica]